MLHLRPLPQPHRLASHPIRTRSLHHRFNAMIPSRDPRLSERAYVHQLPPALGPIPIPTVHRLLTVRRHRRLYQVPVNDKG